MNFAGGFVIPGHWETTEVEPVVKHMAHIKNIAGADTIGWGSDFDGIGAKLEWNGADGMQMLVDALGKAGFTDDELDKVCYKNFLRVMKENEK